MKNQILKTLKENEGITVSNLKNMLKNKLENKSKEAISRAIYRMIENNDITKEGRLIYSIENIDIDNINTNLNVNKKNVDKKEVTVEDLLIKEDYEANEKATDKKVLSYSLENQKIKNANANFQKEIKLLKEELLKSVDTKSIFNELKDVDLETIPEFLTLKPSKGDEVIPTLFLSDIHYDEIVHPKTINNVNEYNREIANKRVNHIVDSALSILKLMKLPLGGFVLALGGDLLSGNIHEELRENNEAPILVSVINLANLLATVIEKIQKELKVHMFIPMVIGNHGRLDKKPRMKNKAEDNYEYILFHMIAKHFVNNKNITCHIPSSADAYYTIYDTKFCLTHGDSFKGGNGIAGIFSPIMRGDLKKRHVQQAVQNPYDVLLIGHFHQLITTKSLIVNGSVKGYDEYAYNMNFGYEDPQQALFLTHPLYGNYAQFAINGIDKSKNPRKNKDRISIIK